MQRADRGFAPRRPSAAGLVVLVLHLLVAALLWQTLRRREVIVRHEPAPLVWVRAVSASPPSQPSAPPKPIERSAPPRTRPTAMAPLPVPVSPHESTWVQVPAPVAAAPAASAASEPMPRLLDSEATRQAIRLAGRQPLLHERAAAAMGTTIERTDTALAQGASEAGLPDCLKDPNASAGQIGPIALGGILGLPFLAARIATGRCAK